MQGAQPFGTVGTEIAVLSSAQDPGLRDEALQDGRHEGLPDGLTGLATLGQMVRGTPVASTAPQARNALAVRGSNIVGTARKNTKTERCACRAVVGACVGVNVKAAGMGVRLPAPGSNERLALFRRMGVKTTAFPWTDPTGKHAGSKARMMVGKDKRVALCHFAASQLSPVKKGRHKGTLTLRRTRSKLSQPNNMMMADMDAAQAQDGPVQARPTRAAAATLREVFGLQDGRQEALKRLRWDARAC
jgi:hypothetical protein